MMDIFKKEGYKIVDFGEDADIYIINSCTVTNEAARKSRQLARKARRLNSRALVVMAGCYPQVSPDEAREIAGIDLVIGTANRNKIVELVKEVREEGCRKEIISPRSELTIFEELKMEELRETTRAYIKIEEGCNQFCTYCIIPYARGPVRSRDMKQVVSEVERLGDKGVKEIVLTGTHLGNYGYDWNNPEALTDLIEGLINIKKIKRIRLSSIEINEVGEKLQKMISSEEKLCSHLHIPLQSGSNHILKKMKRPYTKEEFQKRVKKIRKEIPEIALTTDVIVGFPGENREIFEASFQFVKKINFSRLHVFPFSAREGTPAARMKEQISGNIKKRYSQLLRELNKKLMLSYQEKFHGRECRVIIEEKRDGKTGFLTGITDNYIRVLINDNDNDND